MGTVDTRCDKGAAQSKPLSTIFLFYGNIFSMVPFSMVMITVVIIFSILSSNTHPLILVWVPPEPETRTSMRIAYLGE